MMTVTVTIQEFELFPKMKRKLRGRHFDSNNEVVAAVLNFLEVATAGLSVWM